MGRGKKTISKLREWPFQQAFKSTCQRVVIVVQNRHAHISYDSILPCYLALHKIKPCLRRGNHNRFIISVSFKTYMQPHRMTLIFITISSNRNVECENHELLIPETKLSLLVLDAAHKLFRSLHTPRLHAWGVCLSFLPQSKPWAEWHAQGSGGQGDKSQSADPFLKKHFRKLQTMNLCGLLKLSCWGRVKRKSDRMSALLVFWELLLDHRFLWLEA